MPTGESVTPPSAQQCLDGWVGQADSPVVVEHQHPGAHPLQESGHPKVGCRECLLAGPLPSDILDPEGKGADRLGVSEILAGDLAQHVAALAIVMAQPQVDRASVVQAASDFGEEGPSPVQIVRVHQRDRAIG